MLNGNTAAGRSAQLSGFKLLAFGNAAADIVNDGSQFCSHRNFHQTDIRHISGQRKNFCSLALFRSDGGVPFGTAQNDLSDIGQRFHVVQNARFLPQTGNGREGRSGARHTSFAFDRRHQSRFFAADKCAGALINLQIEIKSRAQNIFAQKAGFLSLIDGHIQTVNGQRILGAAVNVSVF